MVIFIDFYLKKSNQIKRLVIENVELWKICKIFISRFLYIAKNILFSHFSINIYNSFNNLFLLFTLDLMLGSRKFYICFGFSKKVIRVHVNFSNRQNVLLHILKYEIAVTLLEIFFLLMWAWNLARIQNKKNV